MAKATLLGELVPLGGGDPIPLTRDLLTVGRRSSCDIRLDFHNVSGQHCEFAFQNGYWQVRDLGSTNGIKVNGERTTRKILRPGDEVSISSHRYTIRYEVQSGGLLDEALAEEDNIFGQSLMEKAGLEKPKQNRPGQRS
ncbi:MAG: FHA domain-containing protein [Bacteroidales bacterium]|nr:FHA domain-containing protein [Bacteroidales bacterium]